jgi:hypothetical protein
MGVLKLIYWWGVHIWGRPRDCPADQFSPRPIPELF